MTDEKRIEEIRKRYAAYLGGDRHAYSRADVYAPDDVGELLAALDAERARAVRAEAELDRVRTDNVIFRAAIPGPRLLGELLESIESWDSDGYVDMRDEGIRWHARVLAASQTVKARGGT